MLGRSHSREGETQRARVLLAILKPEERNDVEGQAHGTSCGRPFLAGRLPCSLVSLCTTALSPLASHHRAKMKLAVSQKAHELVLLDNQEGGNSRPSLLE